MSLSPLEAALLAATVLGYLLAMGTAIADAAARKRHAKEPGQKLRWLLMVSAFLLHASLLGARDARLGPSAFTTAPAVLLYVPWCLVLIAGIIDARQDLKALPIFLVPPVVGSLLLAAVSLRGPEVETVKIPATGGSAIWVHIISMVLAFGAFGFAAILSAMYLFLEGQLKTKRFDSWLDLPSLDRLERVSGRFLVSGFSLLTLAIVLGWAQHALTGALKPSWFLSPMILGTAALWLGSGAVVLLRFRELLVGRRLAQATLAVVVLVILTAAAPLLVGGDHAPAFAPKEQ